MACEEAMEVTEGIDARAADMDTRVFKQRKRTSIKIPNYA